MEPSLARGSTTAPTTATLSLKQRIAAFESNASSTPTSPPSRSASLASPTTVVRPGVSRTTSQEVELGGGAALSGDAGGRDGSTTHLSRSNGSSYDRRPPPGRRVSEGIKLYEEGTTSPTTSDSLAATFPPLSPASALNGNAPVKSRGYPAFAAPDTEWQIRARGVSAASMSSVKSGSSYASLDEQHEEDDDDGLVVFGNGAAVEASEISRGRLASALSLKTNGFTNSSTSLIDFSPTTPTFPRSSTSSPAPPLPPRPPASTNAPALPSRPRPIIATRPSLSSLKISAQTRAAEAYELPPESPSSHQRFYPSSPLSATSSTFARSTIVDPRAVKRYTAYFYRLVGEDRKSKETRVGWDREEKSETLDGATVKGIWERSLLPRDHLREVWRWCDREQRGELDVDGFVKGLGLIDDELRRRWLSAGPPLGKGGRQGSLGRR